MVEENERNQLTMMIFHPVKIRKIKGKDRLHESTKEGTLVKIEQRRR